MLKQSALELEQDALLDDMSHSIARLTDLSNDITKELAIQNVELDALDEEMDEASISFGFIDKKMNKLMKRSSKHHYKIIASLIVMIVVLFILIIL